MHPFEQRMPTAHCTAPLGEELQNAESDTSTVFQSLMPRSSAQELCQQSSAAGSNAAAARQSSSGKHGCGLKTSRCRTRCGRHGAGVV